jgi:hypothetical protein
MLRTTSHDTVCHEHLGTIRSAWCSVCWTQRDCALDVKMNAVNGGFAVTAVRATIRAAVSDR